MRLLDIVKINPPLPAVADSLRDGEDLLINAVSPPPADASTCQKRKKCAHSIFFYIPPPLNLKQQRRHSGLVTGAVGVKAHLLCLTFRS